MSPSPKCHPRGILEGTEEVAMTRTPTLLGIALALTGPFLAAGITSADVIHLRNGRTLEGQVVGKTKTHIRLRVAGGQLKLPRQQVARVEVRRPAGEDYAVRARATDMENYREVSKLADWASSRGLGAQARQLRGLARGLQLEQRIARAKRGNKSSAYYDTYAWAKSRGFSPEIQLYLLGELLERWPEHPAGKQAIQALRKALAPKPLASGPTPAELEQAALREKIAEQEAEAEKLKERVAELEAARQIQGRRYRRARSRRNRQSRRRNAKGYFPPLFILNPRERCE